MMLPAGVNKASGVWAALRELGVSRHNLVAIGDGENDLALFEFAEHAVAVQNADTLVKRVANRTTQGAYCEGFLELARDLVATDLAACDAAPQGHRRRPRERLARRDHALPRFTAGARAERQRQGCAMQSTPRAVPREQLPVLHHRRGSRRTAGAGRGQVFGDAHEVPRLTDILAALDQPTASVAINLAATRRRDASGVHRCAAGAAAGAARSSRPAARRDDPAGAFLRCGRRNGRLGAICRK